MCITFPAMPPLSRLIMRANAAVGIVFSLLILTGCGDKEPEYVEVKEVSESPSQAESAMQDMHAGHDHSAHDNSAVPFTYVKPDSWSEKVPSSMVLLAFQSGKPPEVLADMSISAFPGDVGGQLANVNRWRRQVGLGPVAPEALDGFITNLEISGMPAWQVLFTGPATASMGGEPVTMRVSVVSHEGTTWFFKFMGMESAVKAEQANYDDFISSIKF